MLCVVQRMQPLPSLRCRATAAPTCTAAAPSPAHLLLCPAVSTPPTPPCSSPQALYFAGFVATAIVGWVLRVRCPAAARRLRRSRFAPRAPCRAPRPRLPPHAPPACRRSPPQDYAGTTLDFYPLNSCVPDTQPRDLSCTGRAAVLAVCLGTFLFFTLVRSPGGCLAWRQAL